MFLTDQIQLYKFNGISIRYDILFAWQISHLIAKLEKKAVGSDFCVVGKVFLIAFSLVETYFPSFCLPSALDCSAAGAERWHTIWNKK